MLYPVVRRYFFPVILWTLVPVAYANAADELARLQESASEWRSGEMRMLVNSPPQDLIELKRRARMVWSRVNEIAMKQGRVPPEVSSMLARILTLAESESSPGRLALLNESLEAYVMELSMLVDQPELLGRMSTSTPGPFRAGTRERIVQTYSVGSKSMLPGSGLLITQHWSNDIPFQAVDKSEATHVEVSANRPNVKFRSKGLLRGGIHGGLKRAAPVLFFEMEEGTLLPGDQIEISYGGDSGLQLPSVSTDGFVLPVYVKLSEQRPFMSLPIHSFQIIGHDVTSVFGVAPSIVTAGEVFDLRVTSLDEFGNRASGRVPSFEVIVNGEFFARVESGYESSARVPGMVFQQPGVYEIALRSSGGGISGEVNPVKVVSIPSRQILWGNLRGVTTDISSGLGSVEYHIGIARDERYLNFIALSDYDMWMDDWEWENTRNIATYYNEQGSFKVFPGYQRYMPLAKGGNQSVIFQSSNKAVLISQHDEGQLTGFYQKLRQQGNPDHILIVPNTDQPGDWRYVDPGLVSLAEIKSDRGFFEWYGKKFTDRGYRTGFTATQGSPRSTGPTLFPGGLTAVVTTDFEKPLDGIFNSLKLARTYATSGQRMILDFTVNGAELGDRIPYAEIRHISGEVIGTNSLDSLAVMKNGKPIWEKSFLKVDQVDQDTPQAESVWVRVSVYSGSSPLNNQIDLPRQAREWIGYLQLSQGRFESIRAPGFEDVERKRVLINPESARRIDFVTRTRGADSAFLVEVSGVTDDVVFDVNIKQGHENDSETPMTRPPSVTPEVRQKVSLAELYQGRVVRNLPVNGYIDRVEMEIVNPITVRSHRFEFTDNVSVNHGDYYYLKVRQSDDAYGWTSPIWVGGFDLQ
jgi:hypothetical protein